MSETERTILGMCILGVMAWAMVWAMVAVMGWIAALSALGLTAVFVALLTFAMWLIES